MPIGWKDCIPNWALRYTALIERFQHVIRFQTFGHIHREAFDVVRSLSTNKPIGVEYIAGNFGTYDGLNPTARLYKMHENYHVPLDFQVFIFDVEKANLFADVKEPEMELFFDFKRDFDLKNLSPHSHASLSESFLSKPDQALLYTKLHQKQS